MSGPKLFDRTKETTTTTGTGAVTLAGAVSGFRAFTDVLSDGDTCLYAIVGQTSTEWEVGLGTFATSGTTLTRTTVLASSNGGAAVDLSAGTKDVFIDLPASLPTYLNRSLAFASLAAFQDGRLNFPTNGFNLYRDNGSLLVPWGPLFPLTEPISGDFSWVNQGSATITTTNGGVVLADPANASFAGRFRVKTAPSAPYTITAAILFGMSTDKNGGGLFFRNSGTGKIAGFFFQVEATTLVLYSGKYDDANTFNAVYTSVLWRAGIPLFLRIADDNSNRICSYSWDGVNFTPMHSVGRTDFITADQVGFYAYSQNASTPMTLTLLSWKEA